jgi:hypothetical protein
MISAERISKVIPPAPVCVAACAIGTYFVICSISILQIIGAIVGGAVFVFVKGSFGATTLKVAAVVVLSSFLACFEIVWALSFVAFIRGRPWGLHAVVGTYVSIAFWGMVVAWNLRHMDLKIGPSLLQPAVALLTFIICGISLLQPSTRAHCGLADKSTLETIAPGFKLGILGSIGYLAISYAIAFFGSWID